MKKVLCVPVAVCVLAWGVAIGVSFFLPGTDGRWIELGQDGMLFLLSIAATAWAVWAVRRKSFRFTTGCSGGCGARFES